MAPTVFEPTSQDDNSHTKHINELSLREVENSSLDQLLAMDTRPSSSRRKSVTFNDHVEVELLTPEPPRTRTPSPLPDSRTKGILKAENPSAETMCRVLRYAAVRLHKDLCRLVEERDMILLSIKTLSLTDDNQKFYRDKMLANKFALDSRIEEVWMKLRELPLETSESALVYGVNESCELTTLSRRKVLPKRHTAGIQVERKCRSELEMASDYGLKLQKMRIMMVRRDSEIRRDDERSVEDILQHISRALQSRN